MQIQTNEIEAINIYNMAFTCMFLLEGKTCSLKNLE